MVYTEVVSPGSGAQVEPPSRLRSHWYDGLVVRPASTVKVAVSSSQRMRLTGCCTISAWRVTVRVTGSDSTYGVQVPETLTLYWYPDIISSVLTTVSVAVLAPW
ncbi:MAG: hypothetical protein BWY89_00537 [Bacteroidetes bacterium ADurb.BinA012]|nr:MAG: hypothetical protein BWY89_00537 [Bacteroidetes bacterium ADurb.BinA012]